MGSLADSVSTFHSWFIYCIYWWVCNEKPTYLIKEKAADGCLGMDSQSPIWLIFYHRCPEGKHLDVFLMRSDHWLSRLLPVVLQVYWSNLHAEFQIQDMCMHVCVHVHMCMHLAAHLQLYVWLLDKKVTSVSNIELAAHRYWIADYRRSSCFVANWSEFLVLFKFSCNIVRGCFVKGNL